MQNLKLSALKKAIIFLMMVILFPNLHAQQARNKTAAFSQHHDDIDLIISNPKIINTENGSIILNHDILIRGNVLQILFPIETIIIN